MSVDLLRAPVVGPFLRWRHARTCLQAAILALAALVILDGLFGPSLAPRNLAGTLPWVHWRGFVVLALLVVGNLFCMACPFMLTRRLAVRWLPADRPWPRALRTKWLAVLLLALFFWAYEAFDLWASPWWTAWIALGYFVAAFVVDGFFRGSAFCKHLCPIGQFHFVNSAVSPFEVAVRDPSTCSSCETKDCIRGRRVPSAHGPIDVSGGGGPTLAPEAAGVVASWGAPDAPGVGGERVVQSGCQLWLFQPRKVGNMDCTFCMECIHACPWDNVGILSRVPARELWEDPWRSGVGRFSERPDLAALAVLLTFAAFLNAFGMVPPVYALQERIGAMLGGAPSWASLSIVFVVALGFLPALLLGGAAALSRTEGEATEPLVLVATRWAWALVPVGFAMWIAHHLYHFLLGGFTVVPVVLGWLRDLGIPAGPTPAWALGAMIPESWLFPLQALVLEAGAIGSVVVAWRIARRIHPHTRSARRAFLPWAGVAVLLSLVGMWLLAQPMEMRGTLGG